MKDFTSLSDHEVIFNKEHNLLFSQHMPSSRNAPVTQSFLHRGCFPVFHHINLRTPGSFGMLFFSLQGKLASLQQEAAPTAKITFKYVVPICIWKDFWQISRDFACFCEFRGISRIYLKFASPQPREISEALSCVLKLYNYWWSSNCFII